jgi:hypothetical protein
MDGHSDTLLIVHEWVISDLIASIEESTIWLPKADAKGLSLP